LESLSDSDFSTNSLSNTLKESANYDTQSEISDENFYSLDQLNNETVENIIQLFNKGFSKEKINGVLIRNNSKSDEIEMLSSKVLGEDFEKLRVRSQNIENKRKRKPEVLIASFGTVREYKTRADYARSFFETGGFSINAPQVLKNAEQAVETLLQSKSDLIVICSADEKHESIIPLIIKELKRNSIAVDIYIAGNLVDNSDRYKKDGINQFIFKGCNLFRILSDILTKIEGEINE